MATLQANSQLEGCPRRRTSSWQDGQKSTLGTRPSSFQNGQNYSPRTLRRVASMLQDDQFQQTSSPRMLRRTASTYHDGHYEVARSPRTMVSECQEARSPTRPKISEGHFETAPPPRLATQMPNSLYPDDLLAPPMARSPLPRTGSFFDGSQFEGGGTLTPNGLYQECPKLSPIPSKKMTSMFDVARSLEKIISSETNNPSLEIKVNH